MVWIPDIEAPPWADFDSRMTDRKLISTTH